MTADKVVKTEKRNYFMENMINFTQDASTTNNQMKTITLVMCIIGVTFTLSNIVTIATNIHNAKMLKTPKIVNNIYVNKTPEVNR